MTAAARQRHPGPFGMQGRGNRRSGELGPLSPALEPVLRAAACTTTGEDN